MDILEVIALLSLCIACIKLGMEINKNAKKYPPQSWQISGYFLTTIQKGNRLSEAPFLYL